MPAAEDDTVEPKVPAGMLGGPGRARYAVELVGAQMTDTGDCEARDSTGGSSPCSPWPPTPRGDDFSTGRMDNIAHLIDHPGFELVRGDITDEGVVEELACGADVLVHLAASVGVKLILEQPVRTIENNVVGTETVLKAARRHEKKILVASTSEVYGKGTGCPSPRRTTWCSVPPPRAAEPTPHQR